MKNVYFHLYLMSSESYIFVTDKLVQNIKFNEQL